MKIDKTYLSARVSMVIRIKIMFRHLLGILLTDFILAHFLADAWVQLTHLRPLAHFVATFVEIFCGLNGSAPCRGPYNQWLQLVIFFSLIKHFLSFRLPMSQQALGHLLRVIFT